MRIFKRFFNSEKVKTETPAISEPTYYKNLFEMIKGLKAMLDAKHLTYPFSGINNLLFDKNFQSLTADEKSKVERLIDNLVNEVLFFQTLPPDSTPDDMANTAATELVLMTARIFQDMPLYGQITIH